MTPQEKAEDLFHTCALITLDTGFGASKSGVKKLALVAVDEILRINSVDKDEDLSNYWEEVKKEIQKL